MSHRVRAGVVFASVAVLAAATSCAALKDILDQLPTPTAHISDAKLADLSLTSVKLDVGVDVDNPYTVDLPIANLDYALSSSLAAGKSLFSGKLADVGSIPAKGKRNVRVPVEVGFASLLELIPQLKRGSVVPYAADLKLGLSAPGGQHIDLPLRHEGKLPVPDVPSVEVAGVKMNKLDFSGVDGTISLKVANPNEFAVTLSKLTAGLELGGVRLFDGGVNARPSFAAGQTQPIDIGFKASVASAASALLESIKNGKASYKLAGDVEVDSEFGKFGRAYTRESQTSVTK